MGKANINKKQGKQIFIKKREQSLSIQNGKAPRRMRIDTAPEERNAWESAYLRPLSYGMPSAFGARDFLLVSTSTIMVTTYGSMR